MCSNDEKYLEFIIMFKNVHMVLYSFIMPKKT